MWGRGTKQRRAAQRRHAATRFLVGMDLGFRPVVAVSVRASDLVSGTPAAAAAVERWRTNLGTFGYSVMEVTRT